MCMGTLLSSGESDCTRLEGSPAAGQRNTARRPAGVLVHCVPAKRGVPSEPAAPLAKRHLACRSSGEVVGGSSVRTWVSRIAFAVVAAVRGYGYPYHTKPLLRDPQAQLRQATRHTCYCDLITHRESHRRYCYNV